MVKKVCLFKCLKRSGGRSNLYIYNLSQGGLYSAISIGFQNILDVGTLPGISKKVNIAWELPEIRFITHIKIFDIGFALNLRVYS